MASTYENDLRLEEMATGENSGSWGTKTNTNLELIADAFSYGTETIANADTTITIADGAADAARSLALKINSSADLTTTRTITLAPNTTSKVWIIENNTSGGQTLTISAGSGSNVTLANGTTKIIATDGIGAGSNVVELTQDLAIADMSVDGILSLADGSNSAPSLTNTGDINTGLYFPAADEVGITTGGTQRLKVSSTGVDVTGVVSLDDGSNSAPSLTNTGDINTGLYFPAADEVGITTGGTQRVKVDSTGVNITGTLVSDGLTVDGDTAANGNLTITTSSNTMLDLVDTSSSFRPSIRFMKDDGGVTQLHMLRDENGELDILRGASSVRQARFGSNGDISFYDTDGTTASFVYDADAGTTFNDAGADRDFQVKSDNNTHMLFVDAGNDRVGVGTSTTYGTLTVNGSISNTGTYDGGYYYSPYQLLSTSVVQNSPRYIILARVNSSGRFINGTIYGARATASSATRTQRYDVAVAVNSSGAIQQANVTQYGYPPSDTVEVRTFTYDGADYVGLYIGTSGSSAYPTGYYFEGIASSIGEVIAVDDSLPTSVAAYTGTVGNTGLRNQSFLVYNGSTTLNESGGDYDFRVESDSYTHMLFVDAENNRVSIGESTNAPNAALEVVGGVTMTAGWDRTLEVAGDSGSGFPVIVWNSQNVGYAGIGYDRTNTTSPMKFWTGSTTSDVTLNGQRALELGISGGETVFNSSGADIDFRVESDGQEYMLFVDASSDRIGINEASPDAYLHISGMAASSSSAGVIFEGSWPWLKFLDTESDQDTYSIYNDDALFFSRLSYAQRNDAPRSGTSGGTAVNHLELRDTENIFNNEGQDIDFRVESDGQTHALFVDAADDFVGINSSDTQYGHVTIVPGGTVNSNIVQVPNTTWGILALRRTSVTSALNDTTVDVFRFLKRDNSTIMGTSHSSGSIYFCIRGNSGADQGNYHYSLQHNGLGATGATFTLVSSSSRGTNPVSSIGVVNDGATGGIKVQVTYIDNSGVVAGGQCRVLYDGIISPT